jgi:hypothetical protein
MYPSQALDMNLKQRSVLTKPFQPITDVTTEYIACNGGPNPTTASSDIINVKAGDTVQATWRHTLTSEFGKQTMFCWN